MCPCRISLEIHTVLDVVACVFQLDIVAFASLAQIYFIDKEVQYSLRDYMQDTCPNLVGHVNRMKERYVVHTHTAL
jgi:predicted ATP-dependent Lon-type protease